MKTLISALLVSVALVVAAGIIRPNRYAPFNFRQEVLDGHGLVTSIAILDTRTGETILIERGWKDSPLQMTIRVPLD